MDKFLDDSRLVRMALAEDIGTADITTLALQLKNRIGKATVTAKSSGVISGINVFKVVYKTLSPAVTFNVYKRNGSPVVPGDAIIDIRGPLATLLMGERTAMNFLCHLSGVATMTRKMVDTIQKYPARILDTRKTTPGMRYLEKMAVRDGGGTNHRFGLFDMYLIKENHIAAVGGIEKALAMVSAHSRKTKAKIEVEVRNLAELKLALRFKPDYILLDNFSVPMLRKAVNSARKINPKAVLEASGNVSLETVRKIAATGVNRISVGKITHSAPVLDLCMKILELK